MTQTTDKHNWTIPEVGETGWGTILNNFFDGELDEDVPHELASSTATLTGGSTPALNTTIQSVTTDQVAVLDVVIGVATDPAFAADYAFNYDWSQKWDDANQEIDIELTVNWDTDPGAGNDVTIVYSIQERGL